MLSQKHSIILLLSDKGIYNSEFHQTLVLLKDTSPKTLLPLPKKPTSSFGELFENEDLISK